MEALEYESEDNNKRSDSNIDDNENDLIDRYEVNENVRPINEDIIKNNKRKRLPLLFYVFILSVLLLIGFVIFLIVVKVKKKVNYHSENDKIEKSGLSEYKYLNLTFDNGLQVLLIQIQEDEKAGGSIVFDVGKIDNQYQYGELDLALLSLLKDVNNVDDLKDYLGEFKMSVGNYYSYYSFNILNAGFFDYLARFGSLTHVDDNDDYNEIINKKKEAIPKNELEGSGINNLDLRENIILENITYGCNNTFEQKNPDFSFDNEKIKDIMKKMTKPNRMKIVLASHFKLSLMRKKFLKHFNHIVNAEENTDKDISYDYNENNFSAKKLVFFNLKEYEKNYLKIIYFVNKTSEDYYEFIDKLGYFKYLKYIIEQRSEGSLYHYLTNSTNYTIKSISCDFEVVLKSKIKFSITINLAPAGYKEIENIIFGTYEYIDNLIKKLSEMASEDEKCDENSRLNELIELNKQDFIFKEDPDYIMEFTKDLGIKLFDKKNNSYFFKENWINSLNKEDVQKYFSQIKPNNSVLFVALNEFANNRKILNTNKCFHIDLDNLYNNSDNEGNLNYLYSELDTDFENCFSNTINISFNKNEYISKYSKPIQKEETNYNSEKPSISIINTNSTSFNYMKDSSFGLPKVFISLNILHPYFRPKNQTDNNTNYYCTYFEIILYLTYIERETELKLADAIRAHNEFIFKFSQNFIYIDIFAYEDVAQKIASQVQEIMNNSSSFSDIIGDDENKYEFYVQSAIEDHLETKTIDLPTKVKYLFYYSLNDEMFKNYEFPNEYNNLEYLCNCNRYDTFNKGKDYITSFIIDGHIYGYYDLEKAKQLAEIFNKTITEDNFNQAIDNARQDFTTINLSNFKQWITKTGSMKKYIVKSIDDGFKNHKFRYIYWDKYSIVNRVKSRIFSNIIGNNYKVANSYILNTDFMHYNGYSYLKLDLYYNKNNETVNVSDFKMHFENLTEYIIHRYNEQKDNYTKYKIDTIGNRLYYLATNIIEEEKFVEKDMKFRGIVISNEDLYIKNDFSLLESQTKALREMDYNELIAHFKKNYNDSADYIDIANENLI